MYNRSIEFQHRCNNCEKNYKWKTIECRVTSANANALSPPPSTALTKEPHKYFDHVTITVRGGDGGDGAILNQKAKQEQVEKGKEKNNKEKMKKNKSKGSLKRDFDGSLILPIGGHGGDVVIYADETIDTLLGFHGKTRYVAKRGGNVDSTGLFRRDGISAPTLRIPVPLGLHFCFIQHTYFLVFCSILKKLA